MHPQLGRWEHSRIPRDGVEQRGYDAIGAMIRRRRVAASLTQRRLEEWTGIDQTVISRLENGKQYGLRWARFAILVGVLDGLEAGDAPPPRPWWERLGITPPDYALDELRAQGLWPPASDGSDTSTTVERLDSDQSPED